MKQFVPCKIDVDTLINKHPVDNIKHFKRDKLIHILSLVNELPAYFERYDSIHGYVPLNAQLLQSRVHNYKEYIDYLVNAGVLECDNHYVVGEKSKGYRFTKECNSSLQTTQISDSSLVQKIKKHQEIDPKINQSHSYVAKWWDDELSVDYEQAIDQLNSEMLHNLDLQIANSFEKYNATYIHLNRFKDCDYYISVDKNIGRFHSNLTNMKSEYRNYIRYGGENLVSVDIQNSQPYLSTMLLNPDFYNKDTNINGNDFNIGRILKTTSIDSSLHLPIFPPPMLVTLPETPIISDIQLFLDLVSQGQLYDYLQMKFVDQLGLEYDNRKAVKQAVFTILFTGNQFIGQEEAKPKKLFRELFPTVYDLFAYIKSKDKKLLPIILQRIESYLVLEIICKRITKEHPSIPLFTVHDSIATTVGNEKIVRDIMHDELTKYIGLEPSLKYDYWFNPEDFEYYSESNCTIA